MDSSSDSKFPRTMRREEHASMGVSLAQAVAALMGRCARRLSRAARRMQERRLAGSFSLPSTTSRAVVPLTRKALSWPKRGRKTAAGTGADSEEWSFEASSEDGVWRKEILMGERCQPLEFSGAIYYDAEGRRLGAPPTPRTPARSPLPASAKLAANA